MSDGLFSGWDSNKIEELSNNKNSTENVSLKQASLIGTLPVYVSVLVMPLGAYSTNQLGRKWTIILGALLLFSSWLMLIFVERIEYIFAAVVFRGLSLFVLRTNSAIYIAEISQANIRGYLSTLVTVFMNVGIFLSYICILATSVHWLAILGAVVVGLAFPLLLWVPESPYFLCLKNKPEEAKRSLRKFRNTDDLQQELDDIKTTIERNHLEKGSIKQFFMDKICRKVSFIVLSAIFFQQFSGIDAISMYLQVILKSFGSSLSREVSSVIFGSAKLSACIVSVILVDKAGRRCLMISSCILSTLALSAMGLYFYVKDVVEYDVESISWIPLTILIFFVLGYNIGLGTVPTVLAGEMFPTKFKAVGVAVVQLMYAVLMVAVSQLFPVIQENYGFHTVFWFFAAVTFFGVLFSFYCILETKGKTLIQILIELE